MSQQYKRIAVKIGSNVLTRKDGALDVTRMSLWWTRLPNCGKTVSKSY